jgi:hypothetical protein
MTYDLEGTSACDANSHGGRTWCAGKVVGVSNLLLCIVLCVREGGSTPAYSNNLSII